MELPPDLPVQPPPGDVHSRTAVIYAGIVSSLVFQILEAVLIPLFGGGSPWGPMRMIAAMVLGRGVLPPPPTFSFGVALVALVVDIVLAIIYVYVLSWFVYTWKLWPALAAAGVFGVALFFVNFYGFTVLFPWFVMGRNWVTLFTHVVFSVVAVLMYKKLAPEPGRPVEAHGANS